jgi:hypothetical protein
MSSIVELYPAHRKEVLASLTADVKQKLDVLRNANDTFYELLGELLHHLNNCKTVLQALPSSDDKLNLESAIEERQADIVVIRGQCERHRDLAESAIAQYPK